MAQSKKMNELENKLIKFFKDRNQVKFAYVFGSQAHGKTGPLSDIDMAVYIDDKIDRNEYFDLKLRTLGELMDYFGSNEIDLVVLNEAPPLLAHRILREGHLVFSVNEKIRLQYESKTVLKYLDWKPFLTKYTQEIFGPEPAYG